jgi:hypothetical protein
MAVEQHAQAVEGGAANGFTIEGGQVREKSRRQVRHGSGADVRSGSVG